MLRKLKYKEIKFLQTEVFKFDFFHKKLRKKKKNAIWLWSLLNVNMDNLTSVKLPLFMVDAIPLIFLKRVMKMLRKTGSCIHQHYQTSTICVIKTKLERWKVNFCNYIFVSTYVNLDLKKKHIFLFGYFGHLYICIYIFRISIIFYLPCKGSQFFLHIGTSQRSPVHPLKHLILPLSSQV